MKKLWIDQYDQRYWTENMTQLRKQLSGSCSKMYVDGKDGKVYHVGYVIGKLWLNCYTPMRELES